MAHIVTFCVDLDRFDDPGQDVGGVCHDLNGLAYRINGTATRAMAALEEREQRKPGSVTKYDRAHVERLKQRAAFVGEFSEWLWREWKTKKRG